MHGIEIDEILRFWFDDIEHSRWFKNDPVEIIERFGRFPHRNAALGRRTTAEEDEYLKDGKAGF